MRILVTGGCGYVGSVLVPKLLSHGHKLIVVDLQWFGNFLEPHDNLQVEHSWVAEPVDAIIHLAAIANDPTGELDQSRTWETNALQTMQMADWAARVGVKQFIYASSGSVYGVSDDPQVTELSAMNPVSAYNKTKQVAERCLLSYADRMAVQILRPATICGLSPRQRLDVVVNMLTMQALTKGEITVLGGTQYRPNLHIEDMCDAYLFMLDHPQLTGTFNVGFENLTVAEIANRIAKRTGAKINFKPSNDPRSYRMNSDKIMAHGFRPKRTVQMAIAEMVVAYKAGKLLDEDHCYNIRTMQAMA